MIDPENWRPADGLELEPNAFTAATEPHRSTALTAGPGAGKSEMLAQRADFLLQTGLCRYPKRILAISFKVDAKQNLKARVKRRCGPSLSSRFDSYTFHGFAKLIIDRFRPILTGRDALDADYTIGEQKVTNRQITFKDLVPLAIKILKNSIVAKNAIRQTYSDVFLDEFQDCTNFQYDLIKQAFHNTNIRLIAVGDTKQRIMGWAGALEGIFAIFAGDFNAMPLNLYRNFRSQPQLLRMQNEIIRELDLVSVMSKELIEGDGGMIELQDFANSQDEATSLAKQIDHWITEEKLPYSEIAVLVSKQPDLYAELLLTELENRGIPVRNEQQLQDLSAEPVTRLIVDYLLVLFCEREPNAYTRLMSQLTDEAIDEHDQSRLQSNWHQFLKVEKKKSKNLEIFDSSFKSSWNFAKTFLNKYGLDGLTALSPDYESKNRLMEVIRDVKKRLSEKFSTTGNMVDALLLLTDDQAVRIMTIHKSKGLEFDSVIILGVEEETFWGDSEENRCAYFVGISRAKRRLILTWSNFRQRPANFNKRWDQKRTPHNEYLGYANKVLETS